ncbi:MAG: Na(+)/H(+) antiporter subunit B [Gemmatimonadota bacterium]
MRDQVILRIGVKVLIPLILVFALYVQFHGDFGPGGGFQAGVIFAAGFVLYGLVFGLSKLLRVLPKGVWLTLAPLGVMIYAGVGVVALLKGGAFLDYNVLRHDPVHGQHLGIMLVELGVLTTVFAVMTGIFVTFAERGNGDE